MITGDSQVAVVAPAPPVLVTDSGNGDGSTSRAVASPRFVTSTETGNACPRSIEAGTDTKVTASDAGVCTAMLVESTAGADASEPEFASVPNAPAWRTRAPVPLPFSTKVKLKLAVPPPGMSWAPVEGPAVAEAFPVAMT